MLKKIVFLAILVCLSFGFSEPVFAGPHQWNHQYYHNDRQRWVNHQPQHHHPQRNFWYIVRYVEQGGETYWTGNSWRGYYNGISVWVEPGSVVDWYDGYNTYKTMGGTTGTWIHNVKEFTKYYNADPRVNQQPPQQGYNNNPGYNNPPSNPGYVNLNNPFDVSHRTISDNGQVHDWNGTVYGFTVPEGFWVNSDQGRCNSGQFCRAGSWTIYRN